MKYQSLCLGVFVVILSYSPINAQTMVCQDVRVLDANTLSVGRLIGEGKVLTDVKVRATGYKPHTHGILQAGATDKLRVFVEKASSVRIFMDEVQSPGVICGEVIGEFPCKSLPGFSDYISLSPLMVKYGYDAFSVGEVPRLPTDPVPPPP